MNDGSKGGVVTVLSILKFTHQVIHPLYLYFTEILTYFALKKIQTYGIVLCYCILLVSNALLDSDIYGYATMNFRTFQISTYDNNLPTFYDVLYEICISLEHFRNCINIQIKMTNTWS